MNRPGAPVSVERGLFRLLLVSGLLLATGFGLLSRLDPFHRQISATLAVQSALFLIYAGVFLWLKRHNDRLPIDGKPAWTAALLVLGFGIVFRAFLLPTAPTLSDDIFRYVWDGRVQQAGINPYVFPPADPELVFLRDSLHPLINHPTVRTVYPPLVQAAFRIVVAAAPTVLAMKAAFTFFDVALVVVLMVLLRAMGRSPAWALAYAWNPLTVVEFASSGHNDSLMLLLLVGAVLLFVARRPLPSAAAFALAAQAKLIPVIMIPWLLIRRRMAIVWAAVMAVTSAPFMIGVWLKWQSVQPATTGLRAYGRDWVFNPSLYGWLSALLPAPTPRKVFLGVVLTVGAFGWARVNRSNPTRYIFGALFALLLCSPVVHPWYVVWLLPFLGLFPLWSVLAWSWAVNLSYVVQIGYVQSGVWSLPAWVPAVEYALVYGVLVAEGIGALRRRARRLNERSALGHAGPVRAAVIIPALNEERALPLVIAEIPRADVGGIIVVDNGSRDRTAEAAREAGAVVIAESAPGYGRAVQRGLRNLPPDCDTVVILDGDHSDFPEELPKLLDPLKEGRADLVIGSRTHAALPGSLMPQQRFGNWLTCTLLHLFYGASFTDMGPFRAIRRDALESLGMKDPTFGWNVEMQVKALRKGLKIVEVPVRYRPRIGTSKISGTLKGTVLAGAIILWSLYRYAEGDDEEDAASEARVSYLR